MSWTKKRAEIANLIRHHPEKTEEIQRAKEELVQIRAQDALDAAVSHILANWHLLDPEQKSVLKEAL